MSNVWDVSTTIDPVKAGTSNRKDSLATAEGRQQKQGRKQSMGASKGRVAKQQ